MRYWNLLLALGALLICGCGQPEESGSTFTFARGSDALKLDPANVEDGESVNTLTQIFEGLVRFKSGTLDIEPWLAESYSISEDGLTYRFKIRDGVRFHDGTALDAAAAAYSFLRQMDASHPGHSSAEAYSYWNALYQDIEDVRVAAKMELEIRLKRPNAAMLRNLAIFPAWLLSPNTKAAGTEPVGTGPYRFVAWRPKEAIILARNDDYWGAAPAFETLVLTVVPDNSVRLLQLKTGAVDGMDGLQPSEAKGLMEDPEVTVYQEPGLNLGYLSLNVESPRLANPEVRRALALAIDREKLATVALEGAGSAADWPLPPGFLGYPKSKVGLRYDLAAARELIAPHRSLFEERPLEITVMTNPRPYLPDPVVAASFVKGQIEQLGIPVKVVALDFKTHLSRLRDGDYEAGLIGWVGDNGDSDNFIGVLLHSDGAVKGAATNFSFYRSKEMDTVLDEARQATKPARRAQLYEAALQLWQRDLPLVPLCHGNNLVALRSEFSGFQLQKIGDLRLSEVQVSAD